MKTEFMNDAESLDWAKSVHDVPKAAQAVVVYGNEDAPTRIDCYLDADPRYDDQPFAQITYDQTEGAIVRTFATLYDELVEAGIALQGRESDLTFLLTSAATDVLRRHPPDLNLANLRKSDDPADDGAFIYQVPFAFMPYWRTKAAKRDKARCVFAYRRAGGWAFDDPTRGLRAEALVAGADAVCDVAAASFHVPPLDRLRLTFAEGADLAGNPWGRHGPSERHTIRLGLTRSARRDPRPTGQTEDGTWYEVTTCVTTCVGAGPNVPKTVWLCPALLRYFAAPPAVLSVVVTPA